MTRKSLAHMMLILLLSFSLAACGQVETSHGEAGDGEGVKVPVESTLKVNQEENKLLFELELKNVSEDTIELPFSSGQQFEIVVKDEEGNERYRYSDGKSFTMALETVEIKADESLTWQDEWVFTSEDVQEGQELAIEATVVVIESELDDLMIQKESLGAATAVVIETFEAGTEEKGSDSDPGSDSQETNQEATYENDAFRNIKIEGQGGQYTITGEARVFEGTFQYAVTEGHYYLVEDFYQTDGAPAWGSFTIEMDISKAELPKNGTLTLELWEESAKDGSHIHPLSIPIETFHPES